MDKKGETHYSPEIQRIINKHNNVFGLIPPGAPPDRGFEHIIELEEGAKPVITTPYKHSKKYKDEIEKAIKELLDMGHIRPSSSLFASSVVLPPYTHLRNVEEIFNPLGVSLRASES